MRIKRGFLSGLILMLMANTAVIGQGNLNLKQIAHVPNAQNLSDIWGYVAADGTEYAIIGTTRNTEVYSLAVPSDPKLVFSVRGASSIWRDIKTLGNYAYVTTDTGADGITILDLTNAPDGITSTKVKPTVKGVSIEKCHNLYIDTNTQIMFLAGCNIVDGVLAFDITTNPLEPILINEISTSYAHDVFVRDGLAFASEIFGGELVIYDISDIQNPVEKGSVKTTNRFTHNAWSSSDNKYVFTTDEVANGTIDAYDITDLMNPVKIGVFVPESILGKGVVTHNTHWMNDYLITSWYDYGVVITDVSNPSSIIETGHFNTGESPDCWGVYPYLPSGLILASDIANGLYVLRPNYQRAAFIIGKVTDAESGSPIFDVAATLLGTESTQKRTNPKGEYVVGQLDEGTITLNFNHPDYGSRSFDVKLSKGETAKLDVQLTKSSVFTQTIKTLDARTGDQIGEVDLQLESEGYVYNSKTDADGSVSAAFAEGNFTITAGKWGFKYKKVNASFTKDGTTYVLLERSYQDDFIFDYGWTAESTNERSKWVRVEPSGTVFGGQLSNPAADVDDDLGASCYITGNGSGGVGAFDVDDGISVLISPSMDLSGAPNATLQFNGWFFNDGGSNISPNDTFKIFARNGITKVLLHQFTTGTEGWEFVSEIILSDFLALNEQVQISFEAGDEAESGHLVEAGLDAFFIDLRLPYFIEDNSSTWDLYPNPVVDQINLFNFGNEGDALISIFAIDGRLISRTSKSGSIISIDAPHTPGLYIVHITAEGRKDQSIKIVK